MGIWDRIKKGYTSIDRRVGGYLPGGSSPGSSSSSTPASTTSGTSSSGTSSLTGGGGSYNPSTKTYTSPSGEKQSRSYSNVPRNTAIDLSGGGSSRGGSSSSGGSSNLGQPIQPATPTNNAGYIGSKPSTNERGVLTVTPNEASALKNSGVPYWVQQAKSPAEAVSEGSFISNVPQINRNLQTRNLYLYNQRNVLGGQETYRQYNKIVTDFKSNPSSFEGQTGVTAQTTKDGISYQLSPDYFDNKINTKEIYKDSLAQAKVNLGELSASKRFKIRAGSYGVGVSSAVLGFGEFGGTVIANMGTATSDESGKFQKRSVKFGGALGEIRNYPPTPTSTTFLESPGTWIKQKTTTPEFLGGATVIVPTAIGGVSSTYSNIKTLGWKAGTVETIAGASPFKIKPGIYAQPIKADTKFTNIKSIKYKNDAGVTTRVYAGSSGNIKLSGFEQSRTVNGITKGGGFTQTKTPYIEIRGGGAYVTTGTRTTINPYVFSPTGSGKANIIRDPSASIKVYPTGLKGGTSQIVGSKGLTSYSSAEGSVIYSNLGSGYKFTGGGASRNIKEGVKVFGSGKAQPYYKTTNLGGRTVVYEPTGSYKVNPKIAGTEYDLNILMRGSKTGAISTGRGSFSGGGGSGTITKLKLDGGSLNAVVPTTVTTPGTATTTTLFPAVTSPFKTITKQTFKPISTTIQTPKVEVKTGQETINAIIPTTKTGSRSKSGSRSVTIQLPQQKPITQQKPKQETATIPKVIQVQKIKAPQTTDLRTVTPFTFRPSTYTPYEPPIKPPVISLPIGWGGGMGMGIGNVKARKSPTAYTPSFTALFFKIKGKAPKGVATGIRFRPIISVPNKRKKKVIRVRRVKI